MHYNRLEKYLSLKTYKEGVPPKVTPGRYIYTTFSPIFLRSRNETNIKAPNTMSRNRLDINDEKICVDFDEDCIDMTDSQVRACMPGCDGRCIHI